MLVRLGFRPVAFRKARTFERHRRNSKEVQCRNHLAVIGQEGQPTFSRIAAPPDMAQIPGYRPLRNGEAQLQKFAVYFGCAPSWIFIGDTSDQRTDFGRRFRSAAARSRTPPPEEPKSRPMPADYRLRFHNDQDFGPSGPNVAQRRPEQPVPRIQPRARTLPLEDGDLLPQGQDFQGSVVPTAEENSNGGQESKDESEHES